MFRNLFLLSFFYFTVNSATYKYHSIPLNEAVNNPERGFYFPTETHSPIDYNTRTYQNLKLSDLKKIKSNNMTLIFRNFYLEGFINKPISNIYLKNMQTDFDVVRESGLKVIVRFSYSDCECKMIENLWDAPKKQVLNHISQLKDIFVKNSDVIAVVQAGFIGVWGEWYYTKNFGYPKPNQIDYQNRREVVNALLAALPDTRMIQIRTPALKRTITNRNTPLTKDEAYKNNVVSRIGHHNDCFLASDNDKGTYTDIKIDYPYLANETLYAPMGGETCDVNLPRSGCETALREIEKFHWSYLNSGYHEKVIAEFKEKGCYYTIQNRLGYRFELIESTFPDMISLTSTLNFQIKVRNSGFATPYNKRIVYLVFKNVITGNQYSVALKTDPRFWTSGIDTHTLISENVSFPSGTSTGSYRIFLNLPDVSPSISNKPDYSIRFANNGTWEASTGLNNLQQVMNVIN